MKIMSNRSKMFTNIPDSTLENISKHLYCFYKKIIGLDYNDFTDAPHIEILADKLENLVHGEITNLCVAMPPRHSKSSMVTLAFPLWLIWNNPNLKILIVNAESSLSETFGLRLREFIDDFSMLTGIYLSDDKHSSTYIKLADENGHNFKGSIRLVGVNGSITGHDADYLIIDDPYKGFEDITPTLLKKKIELFKTKIIQRREPHSKLIICHTRWHTNDIQGYLKENQPDTYEFLEFPAIKPDGESLWSDRYTVDFLKQQLKEMGERLFSSIYQQKPLDETGDFFNLDNIYFDDIFDYKTHYTIATIRSWDLAYSPEDGDKNDSTAGILMHKVSDKYYVITDLQYGQYGDDLKQVLKTTAERDGPNIPIIIETGTKGGAAKFLYNEYELFLTGYITEQSEPIGSKVDRATPFKDAINDGKIHIAITNDEMRGKLIEQLKSFPLGTHDDIIDAMSYAYSKLQLKTDASNLYRTGNAHY